MTEEGSLVFTGHHVFQTVLSHFTSLGLCNRSNALSQFLAFSITINSMLAEQGLAKQWEAESILDVTVMGAKRKRNDLFFSDF